MYAYKYKFIFNFQQICYYYYYTITIISKYIKHIYLFSTLFTVPNLQQAFLHRPTRRSWKCKVLCILSSGTSINVWASNIDSYSVGILSRWKPYIDTRQVFERVQNDLVFMKYLKHAKAVKFFSQLQGVGIWRKHSFKHLKLLLNIMYINGSLPHNCEKR